MLMCEKAYTNVIRIIGTPITVFAECVVCDCCFFSCSANLMRVRTYVFASYAFSIAITLSHLLSIAWNLWPPHKTSYKVERPLHTHVATTNGQQQQHHHRHALSRTQKSTLTHTLRHCRFLFCILRNIPHLIPLGGSVEIYSTLVHLICAAAARVHFLFMLSNRDSTHTHADRQSKKTKFTWIGGLFSQFLNQTHTSTHQERQNRGAKLYFHNNCIISIRMVDKSIFKHTTTGVDKLRILPWFLNVSSPFYPIVFVQQMLADFFLFSLFRISFLLSCSHCISNATQFFVFRCFRCCCCFVSRSLFQWASSVIFAPAWIFAVQRHRMKQRQRQREWKKWNIKKGTHNKPTKRVCCLL